MTKGISPLIAAVLLIAFTMAVAALAGPFMSNIIKTSQESTSKKADKVTTAANLGLKIHSASYNRTTSNLTLAVQNTGDRPVSNISVSVFGDNAYQKSYDRELGKKEIDKFKIYAGDHWDLRKTRVSLENYPVSAERGLDGRPAEEKLDIYYTLDKGSGAFANNTLPRYDGELEEGNTVCAGGSCPNWSTGRFGKAVNVTVGDEMVDDVGLDIGESWTIATWFSYPNNGLEESGHWRTLTRGDGGDHQVIVKNGNYNLGTYDNTGGNGFIDCGFDINSVSDGWHHLAVTQEGGKNGEMRFYLDGRKICSISNYGSTSDIRSVGNHFGEGQEWGNVDEFRFWSTALPESRIKDPVVLE